jgi:hypothetical protein
LAEVQALEHQETRTMNTDTLTPDLLHRMNAYWRAANYQSVGQIYLYDNPLLKEPLKLSRVKNRSWSDAGLIHSKARRAQWVGTTLARSLLAGVSKPRVFRGS